MDVIKCKDCHVAIGAPGRIKHLIDMGYLSTTSLQLLVLDEVDALFDHKEYAIECVHFVYEGYIKIEPSNI